MLVYKEELPLDNSVVKLFLPFSNGEDARNSVLHLEVQDDLPRFWYQADAEGSNLGLDIDTSDETDEDIKNESYKKFVIVSIGTRHDMPMELRKEYYIGSAIVGCGMFVWHYFLLSNTEYDKLAESCKK